MHEISLCEGIVGLLESAAKAEGFRSVKQVWLCMGALSGVNKESMLFGFDAVTRGTLAEGALLHVVDIPATGFCDRCQESVTIQQRYDACPQCKFHPLQIKTGEELSIKKLEVE